MWNPLSKNGDDQLLQLSNVNQKAALERSGRQAAVPRFITQEIFKTFAFCPQRIVSRFFLYKIMIRDLNISFKTLPTILRKKKTFMFTGLFHRVSIQRHCLPGHHMIWLRFLQFRADLFKEACVQRNVFKSRLKQD